MTLNEELTEFMLCRGATLVGFADLKSIRAAEMPTGVSIAVAVPADVIRSIRSGPTMEYYNAYHSINAKLDKIVTAGAEFLCQKGYQAFAQTEDAVVESEDYRTKLPHKTVATRAGLGWIGKCALLVTERYGSAVRLSSLITTAPLECGSPVTESKCGDCMCCTQSCPGKAVSGSVWSPEKDRDEFFHSVDCRAAARKLAMNKIQKEITLCGKCIYVCPYTQRYLKRPV
ncbi:MAG TPA: 4Fe-4S double cluster binding domain-containing protein [Caproiciproducens sp.]|nr:4Fe-4S double cluster binding domain-containing protein [Caproiciproducens sp.]